MRMDIIRNYDDFVCALLSAGFSTGGGKDAVFSLIPWSWNEEPPYETPIRWHTGDIETDPWEWRMRVLSERDDIAYGKLFFKKSGFITREYYPFFLSARRRGTSFSYEYESGKISHFAKRIYDVFDSRPLPLPEIKSLAHFSKEDKSKFDAALTELQTKMYLTICGRRNKFSPAGEEYGWASTVLIKTEDFWGEEVFSEAKKINPDSAVEKITEQILKLNPDADNKKIKKFVLG